MNLAAFLNASQPTTVRCTRCHQRYTKVDAEGICTVCRFVDDEPEAA